MEGGERPEKAENQPEIKAESVSRKAAGIALSAYNHTTRQAGAKAPTGDSKPACSKYQPSG